MPTFAVDDGFAYSIPAGLDLEVGSLVRIPLGGRRVRGFVTALRTVAPDSAPARLKDVAARSGTLPIFDSRMLETLRWAAVHYVGPLATVLGRTAPPNVPREPSQLPMPELAGAGSPFLVDVAAAAIAGRHLRPTAWVGAGPWFDRIGDLVTPVLAAQRSAMIVLPTAVEAHAMADALGRRLPERVLLAGSDLSAKAVTRTWGHMAMQPGRVIVGTREIALWRVARLSMAVIVEEGRRAMKSPQTPTLHVREVLRRRAAVERFPLVTCGSVPTIETIGTGAAVASVPGRAWRLIEVVDRREDPDPGSVITARVRHAVRSVANRDGRVFVMVHRRGYAPAFRCIGCGEVRTCAECGSAIGREGVCRRCTEPSSACRHCAGMRFAPLGAGVGRVVDELRRSVDDLVGTPEERRPVVVGTERDLARLAPVDLAVLLDIDTWLLAPHYRAEEDSLRVIARLAGAVAAGSGRRAMVQTTQPTHRVLAAARHGHALTLLDELLTERVAAGFPPGGSLIAVDLEGGGPETDDELRKVVGPDGDVIGPGGVDGGRRWLIQGTDLHGVRVRLRRRVQQWRDAGIRVRIDADPIDL